MPFVKKTATATRQLLPDTRKIFIGRASELDYFAQHILQPEDPTHNIVSIWGNGGVGKSTLLARFMDEARTPPYEDYCIVALVDERQAAPASIMEAFAGQLRMAGFPLAKFEDELALYKETFWNLQNGREILPAALLRESPETGSMAKRHAPAEQRYRQLLKEAGEDPIGTLTRAFVEELNSLADAQVTLSSDPANDGQTTRQRRIILFFDTFEQLAAEAAPWLLDYFLPADISTNIVLVIAGRDSVERSIPGDPKRWLPYHDSGVIYSINLDSFSEDETRAYLGERGITDPQRVAAIWQLSRGLPLYLSLLTFDPQEQVDPTANVVANFLRWIPEHEYVKRRLALDAALFSRPFNQDDLMAFDYLPESEDERVDLYTWLIRLPFVQGSSHDGRHSYHPLVQQLFSRHLYQRSHKAYYATRRALAEHYLQLLEKSEQEGRELYAGEWFELVRAVVYQLFSLPDQASHVQAIAEVLNAFAHSRRPEQLGEIIETLRELSQEQPAQPVNRGGRQAARQLLRYLEADPETQPQALIDAATYLIEKVNREPAFPPGLLAEAYYNRSHAYEHFQDYRRAIADLDHAIELAPNYTKAYNSRGMSYYALKDYERAIKDFDRVHELEPGTASVYIYRGLAHLELKDYEHAITDFDYALELEPGNAEVYTSRGLAYHELKDYRRAIQDFDQVLELEPGNAQVYAHRGLAHTELGDYQQAIADFDHALELAPQLARVYASRGKVYRLLKDYQHAFADYDHAITLDSRLAPAFIERGLAYEDLKDYRQAIENFDHVLDLQPDHAEAYLERGRSYRRLKDYERAVADYLHARELDADLVWEYELAWTYAERGQVCQEHKDYEGAIQDYSRALELGPQDAWTHLERGLAYLWLKDIERAQADFMRSWELDPTNIRASWLAEWTSMCQVEPRAEFAERLERIAAVEPRSSLAHVCRGVALGLRGNFVQALAELERAISLEAQEWDAYFWKGMVHAALKQDEDAIAAIKKALNLGLPPALLAPLRWLGPARQDFYERAIGLDRNLMIFDPQNRSWRKGSSPDELFRSHGESGTARRL